MAVHTVTNRASTRSFLSGDIDEMSIEQEDCVSRMVIVSGILYHLKILCEKLGIHHLSYDAENAATGLGGFLSLGFKHCTCVGTNDGSQYCLEIPSSQDTAEKVTPGRPNERAENMKAKEDGFVTSFLDRGHFTLAGRFDSVDKAQKNSRSNGKKVYCTHWLSKGICAYMQQGCIYKHEIPNDQETWESLGFHTVPSWLHSKSSAWISQHSENYSEVSNRFAIGDSTVALSLQPRNSRSEITLRDQVDSKLTSLDIKSEPNVAPSPSPGARSIDEYHSPSVISEKRGDKRIHQSSPPSNTKNARKRRKARALARNDAEPNHQRGSFPNSVTRVDAEVNRHGPADSADELGFRLKGASQGFLRIHDEPSDDPVLQRSKHSRDAHSEESQMCSQTGDPSSQASRFLGRWQAQTNSDGWGSHSRKEHHSVTIPYKSAGEIDLIGRYNSAGPYHAVGDYHARGSYSPSDSLHRRRR